MSQLTLEIPETLQHQLELRARYEGVSLNSYIVYALTRQTDLDYTIQALSIEAVAAQKTHFMELRQSLGRVSPAEMQLILSEREPVSAEPELNPEVVTRLRQRIAHSQIQP